MQVRPCLGLLEEDEDEDDVPPEAVSFRIINNFTIAPVSEVSDEDYTVELDVSLEAVI